jgi:hypothetical protein
MPRLGWVVLGVLFAGCGGSAVEETTTESAGGEIVVASGDNQNAPPPDQTPPVAQTSWPGRTGSGQSQEDPVGACGPRDSYAFVAGEFQCPGGGNPLGGDPMAGAQAREGNVGANQSGHIIDLYRVPCPSGDQQVYVDMYACPEMSGALGGQ